MYLCQYSQRHSRVQHCKDRGEDISDQPLQSLSPLRLGGHRVSAWLHLLLNTTTALQLFTLFFEHSHFFSEVGCYLFAQVAQSFTLSSSSPPHFVEHRICVMQNSTEFVFVPQISWPSIIFRFSLSRNIYRERCIILIGDLGRGQGSD